MTVELIPSGDVISAEELGRRLTPSFLSWLAKHASDERSQVPAAEKKGCPACKQTGLGRTTGGAKSNRKK